MATAPSEPPPHATYAEDHPNEPRDGENMADYVNRVRPRGAPVVTGNPVWTGDGWTWQVDGWRIGLLAATDNDYLVAWAQEANPIYWFELLAFGERNIAVFDDPWKFALDNPPE